MSLVKLKPPPWELPLAARLVREWVMDVLRDPGRHRWTSQGFGMVRCYPGAADDTVRLNIWHGRFRAPNVSQIHDHPWDLESLVLAGRRVDRRYVTTVPAAPGAVAHHHLLLQPGLDGGTITTPDVAWLRPDTTERVMPGATYQQRAAEIHETFYEDGTVSVNLRTNRGEDRANVYWKEGPWVSVMPQLVEYPVARELCAIARDRLQERP